MFLERNPFPKDINNHIARIIGSERVRLETDCKQAFSEYKALDTTWEDKLTRPILNRLMSKDTLSTSTSETARVNRISCTFTRTDVPNYLSELYPFIKELFPNKKVRTAGGFYYPPGGFMGWHTNYRKPALRFYITYASHANKSFFRYLNEEGKIVTDYDDKGITLRMFDIPNKPPYFWHCAGSDCDRYSFGSRLYDK